MLRQCPTCDEMYEDPGPRVSIHKHPEPQSGPPRDAWRESGLPYERWIVETFEGRNWHEFETSRGKKNMTLEERQKLRKQQEAKDAKDIEASKARMAKKHGLERNAKFEKAWQIAWDEGHSNGIKEVEYYFEELADLLKPESLTRLSATHNSAVCCLCDWDNVNLLNLGEPNKPRWVCHDCCKQMLETLEKLPMSLKKRHLRSDHEFNLRR